MTNQYEMSESSRAELVYDKQRLLAPVPAGAKPPPHTAPLDGMPTIARYGPQASLSQESVEPIWALLKAGEEQADRELPDDEAVPR
jgi:hypothetical protein